MNRPAPLCVIGLDGVPHDLLARLADEGVMPNVGARIGDGHLRKMTASTPEISSVSWSSFMTGADPGRHGIFGFTDLRPEDYRLRFPSFRDLRTETIWDRLGERGLTSLVLNQPATYPARTIPGALVSGFVAIDLVKAVKPLHHLAALRRIDYRIDIDTARCRRDHDLLFRELRETLEGRRRAVDYFWDQGDWDLLQVVVTGTDRLYHYLWDAIEDPSHPRHQAALDYHRDVDRFVGDLLDRFDRRVGDAAAERTWLLSDHGFCGIVQEVQLNAWLRREGFLELADGAEDLTAIRPTSRAFALDPGRIHVHRKDRYPRGPVASDEVDELKTEIAERLRELEHDGRGVIRRIHDAEEIYRGPCVARGPDLVATAEPGYDLKASPAADRIFDRTDLTGMHTRDDAFLISPKPLEDDDLWIGDLARHLLNELRP